MQRTVRQAYKDNLSAFDTVPMFKPTFAKFEAKDDALRLLVPQVEADDKLAAELSKKQKRVLALAAEAVCLKVRLYARSVGNQVLLSLMSARFATIHRLGNELIASTCRTIHTEAVKVKVESAPFGLTDAMLEALDTAIILYESLVAKPELAHGKTGSAKQQMGVLFKECSEILTQELDIMMLGERTTQPALVATWNTARRLINEPSRSTPFSSTVRDEQGVPLEGVKYVLTKESVKEAVSDEDGMVSFENVFPGMNSLSVTMEGYVPFVTAKLKIVRFADNKLDIVLKMLKGTPSLASKSSTPSTPSTPSPQEE